MIWSAGTPAAVSPPLLPFEREALRCMADAIERWLGRSPHIQTRAVTSPWFHVDLLGSCHADDQ